MAGLSRAAQSLWAKKSTKDGLLWMPLITHMSDCAALSTRLWHLWLPEGVKRTICANLADEDTAIRLFAFLAAAHDIGKATPVFQAKSAQYSRGDLDERIEERIVSAGLPIRADRDFAHPSKTPHALATQILLEHAGCMRSVAVILGAHHGKPQSGEIILNSGIGVYGENYHLGRTGRDSWSAVQRELIGFALDLAGFSSIEELPGPGMAAQVLLSGLVIMVDWMASNEQYYPYWNLEEMPRIDSINARTAYAWERLALPDLWSADKSWSRTDLYSERFPGFRDGLTPNAVQRAVADAAAGIHSPGILVLEAPMGVGKTEAALVAAEIFADKAKRSGVFFALPTQATSNAMFKRVLDWVNNLADFRGHSIRLAHGKAQFNEDYQSLKHFEGSSNIGLDDDDSAFVHGWFEGQKKSMLADFVVGTIDHLLLAALKQKHVMLRHLGLANKIVVIDECHAYDAYMNRYLEMALRWLGAYRVPVIVLSATLPAQRRQMVIDAYLNSAPETQSDPLGRGTPRAAQKSRWTECRSYPLITYTDGGDIRQEAIESGEAAREVIVERITEDALLDRIDDLLSDGGCAGIVVNTIRRAQALTRLARERFGRETVRMLHSQFLAPDRAEKEKELLRELGKPGDETRRPDKRIVVGTQVLEQSLDIDLDVLVTDLSPMDLLLQRIGRLHRHQRPRPEKLRKAHCLVLGADGDCFEEGSEFVYGRYPLMRARSLLPRQLVLPRDIPELVQDAYDDAVPLRPEPPEYRESKEEWDKLIAIKERRADAFRIRPPISDDDLVDWLSTGVPSSEKHAEAAVRDADESFEVLLIREDENGRLCLLSGSEEHELSPGMAPGDTLAKALACQRIRLPRILCAPWMIDKTIEELERRNNEKLRKWQESSWLKGELFLILDDKNSADLCGYRLSYDQDDGLLYEKEDGANEG